MTSYFGFEKDGKISPVLFRTVKRPKEPRKRISKKSLKWIHEHLNEFAWGLLVPTPQQRRKNDSAVEKLECWFSRYHDAIRIHGNGREIKTANGKYTGTMIDVGVLAARAPEEPDDFEWLLLDLAQMANCFYLESFLVIETSGNAWEFQSPFVEYDAETGDLFHSKEHVGKVVDRPSLERTITNYMRLRRGGNADAKEYDLSMERSFRIEISRLGGDTDEDEYLERTVKSVNHRLKDFNLKTSKRFGKDIEKYRMEFKRDASD